VPRRRAGVRESDGEGQSEAARKRAYEYKQELLWLKYEKARVAVLYIIGGLVK